MLTIIQKLASLKFTLVGMVLLGVGASLSYGNPTDIPVWVLVVPMILLVVNLSAAILTNPRINQQSGLLVFHVSLLVIVILAAVGRLTHMDAHIELVVGSVFARQNLQEIKSGPLHGGNLDDVSFVQGPFSVQYAPGMQRGLTHSQVKIKNKRGEWQDKVVGDDRPLIINGYRFYTTFNKGFTSVLTWVPDEGEAVTGTVNMPSYPLFEYKQDNRWTPPGGDEIKFWLQLRTNMDEKNAWVLEQGSSSGVLVVVTSANRYEVPLGGFVQLGNGRLQFDDLRMWMGYRLFYDPTIQWMFFVSIAGVMGLGYYFWKKMNVQPWMVEASVAETSKKMMINDNHSTKRNVAMEDQS
ncbi:MAG: cytochrome c biogenesis protein ResB [Gammaproteobacteria bacterium]|nr:cytochrome c biogenesis protein ResB [Gammaproteobacteria bacterium]